MEGERVVFTEEAHPSQYLKLIASGEVDEVLLEALEDFVKRQKKRLQSAKERPKIPQADYSDDISEEQFEELRAKVADLNDPERKRTIITPPHDGGVRR